MRKYDPSSDVVTTGNAYEQATKKSKKKFQVPDPQKEPQTASTPFPLRMNMKTPGLLKKLRKAAVLCNYEAPDQEIMRILLNKCPDSKFQEKAFLADLD